MNKIDRPRYRFAIPAKARQFPGDPATITLQPLTAGEELKAAEAAGSNKGQLGVEMTRLSVVEVDGAPVDWGTAAPEWIERCSPKVRELAFAAFSRVNRPSDEESASFFGSEELVVAG